LEIRGAADPSGPDRVSGEIPVPLADFGEGTGVIASITHFMKILAKNDKFLSLFTEKIHLLDNQYAKHNILATLYFEVHEDYEKSLAHASIAHIYDPFYIRKLVQHMAVYLYILKGEEKFSDFNFNFIKNGYEIGIKLGSHCDIWNLAELYRMHDFYEDALTLYERYQKSILSGEFEDDSEIIMERIKECKL